MPIDKILEEWIGEEKGKEKTIFKRPKEELDRIEGYNILLQDLKSRIPQIKERIIKMIENEKEELQHLSMLMGDDIGFEKTIDHIINTLKGGKEK